MLLKAAITIILQLCLVPILSSSTPTLSAVNFADVATGSHEDSVPSKLHQRARNSLESRSTRANDSPPPPFTETETASTIDSISAHANDRPPDFLTAVTDSGGLDRHTSDDIAPPSYADVKKEDAKFDKVQEGATLTAMCENAMTAGLSAYIARYRFADGIEVQRYCGIWRHNRGLELSCCYGKYFKRWHVCFAYGYVIRANEVLKQKDHPFPKQVELFLSGLAAGREAHVTGIRRSKRFPGYHKGILREWARRLGPSVDGIPDKRFSGEWWRGFKEGYDQAEEQDHATAAGPPNSRYSKVKGKLKSRVERGGYKQWFQEKSGEGIEAPATMVA